MMAKKPEQMTSEKPPENSLEQKNADGKLAWMERWLSPPRLAPYLRVCAGNVDRALDLYQWNVSLCQVLIADIANFEVALRNAYDQEAYLR